MIKNEYLRFMQHLNSEETSEGVIKLANLIYENFDLIQPLGTQQGSRVKKIVELTQQNWNDLETNITVDDETVENSFSDISKLTSLKVGPFRGFAKQEVFDLDSDLVLAYGPNGTGKSSFCEALEYGLLASVAEAENKRFQPREYLKNAHVNQFSDPVISVSNQQDEVSAVIPNESQFRFCFVEKNRIDDFSRIAAQLPAKQTEIISILFGLEGFNKFVRGFTVEMDGKYIDLSGKKNQELNEKQQVLTASQDLVKNYPEEIQALSSQENELIGKYKAVMTFEGFINELGTTSNPGEIQNLESQLQEQLPQKTDLKIEYLIKQKKEIEKYQSLLSTKQASLENSSTDLSFKQLYDAVIDLNQVSQDECPACKTPLDQTANNPFDLAKSELKKLEHLSQLEQEKEELEQSLGAALSKVHKYFKVCIEEIKSKEGGENLLSSYVVEDENKVNWDWWQSLHIESGDKKTAWSHLQSQTKILEKRDFDREQAEIQRPSKQDRLNNLKELSEKATGLKIERESKDKAHKKAIETIEKFEEDNKQLIEDAEAEKEVIARNQEVAQSYKEFVSQLLIYKESLPETLVADLGETVVELYNAFNRSDAPKDLLEEIKLPLQQGQKIQVSFKGNTTEFFDALHILSEGHIRCIGLAILMAKNIKEDCPILIFDDPVNAIDDEHRDAIRRTLFEDNFFDGKQIILTCHGEEFLKDTQQLLGQQRSNQAKRFTFLPQLNEQHIRVDFHSRPRNYILQAKEHIDKLEIREALSKSRRALESLTKDKVWRYIGKHGNSDLKIILRSAKSPIELRNLTEQLAAKLRSQNFTHQDKQTVLEPIETLLGVDGSSKEWRYLNKGTHEESDREEFDTVTVTTIVDALSDLDEAL